VTEEIHRSLERGGISAGYSIKPPRRNERKKMSTSFSSIAGEGGNEEKNQQIVKRQPSFLNLRGAPENEKEKQLNLRATAELSVRRWKTEMVSYLTGWQKGRKIR